MKYSNIGDRLIAMGPGKNGGCANANRSVGHFIPIWSHRSTLISNFPTLVLLQYSQATTVLLYDVQIVQVASAYPLLKLIVPNAPRAIKKATDSSLGASYDSDLGSPPQLRFVGIYLWHWHRKGSRTISELLS